jgi:hypothetical protein
MAINTFKELVENRIGRIGGLDAAGLVGAGEPAIMNACGKKFFWLRFLRFTVIFNGVFAMRVFFLREHEWQMKMKASRFNEIIVKILHYSSNPVIALLLCCLTVTIFCCCPLLSPIPYISLATIQTTTPSCSQHQDFGK